VSAKNQPGLFKESEAKTQPSENAIHLLALTDVSGVGFATARSLSEAFEGDLARVWATESDELLSVLRKARTPHPTQVIRQIRSRSKELVAGARERYHFLTVRRQLSIHFRGSESYPRKLLDLPNPPPWLFVEGNVGRLNGDGLVAVIGTRTPTVSGLEAAKRLSVALVSSGATILSGLAEGIDEIGHKTAVDHGAPTVAVLGHGIDVVFPAATSGLRRQIVDTGGAVVSEYLPRDTYTGERFVQRNRIQAALSTAVAVVEGRHKSGTAHTVRFARQLKRELFGVRIGEPMETPQQELLCELAQSGDRVFNLDQSNDVDQLRVYLKQRLPLQPENNRASRPRLFRGLVADIERIVKEYDASDADLQWLIDHIRRLRIKEPRDAR
jgi:DNA processing protein